LIGKFMGGVESATGPFKRFTVQARQAIGRGQEEARALGYDYIGTEHLLLGLLSEGESVAAQALRQAGGPGCPDPGQARC
jgi:hypothetical protein